MYNSRNGEIYIDGGNMEGFNPGYLDLLKYEVVIIFNHQKSKLDTFLL